MRPPPQDGVQLDDVLDQHWRAMTGLTPWLGCTIWLQGEEFRHLGEIRWVRWPRKMLN